jgi:MFS family permease
MHASRIRPEFDERTASRRVMGFTGAVLCVLLSPLTAWSQQMPEFDVQRSELLVEGWRGFSDFDFLINSALTMVLAAVLGAVIAYHPRYTRSADTLEELEAPKVFIMYAVIGSLIGIMVVKYGLVIGFVLFGIGGLIRFRTVLRSAHLTGHVIFVTLIGLSSGLDLPHVAVLATAFGFILIYVLHFRITYRIEVRALPGGVLAEAAAAYREVLKKNGCRIMSEKKNPDKGRVEIIFRALPDVTQEHLEAELASEIPPTFKGSLNWEID